MRKYIYPLLAILLLPLAATSCSDDEVTTELSENCYISAFSLGSLKRSIYGVTLAGQDSIYTITYSGALYPMTINHRTDSIVNLDSLPVRTQVDKVLPTVQFDGVLVWRKADITNLEDTTWNTYNSSDSIDFTEPLHFRVYSATGNSSRTYTVQVNVHQQEGDSTVWNAVEKKAPLSGMGRRKAVVWDGKLTLLAENGTGGVACVQHPLSPLGDWTVLSVTGADGGVPATLQVQGNQLYMSTTDGRILVSTDAQTWTAAPHPAMAGLRLAAATDDCLYALVAGGLYRSNGSAWTAETLDDDAANLPVDFVNSVFYEMKSGLQRLTLVGRRNASDTSATVWAKSWPTGGEAMAGWTYYTPNRADKYRCPMLDNLCVVPYDGGLQALGGRSRDGRYVAMDSIFHSADHGITWKTYEEEDMNVEPALRAAAQTAHYITVAVDEDNYLWVVVDEQVWRGRINRLGFLKD